MFRDFIEDSSVLKDYPDFSNENYKNLSQEEIMSHLEKFNLSLNLIEKLYTHDYSFTDEEFVNLINQLNFIDNRYLEDIISLAFCRQSNFIKSNLVPDLLEIYNKIIQKK